MQKDLNDDFTDNEKVETGNFHNFKEQPTVIGILLRIEKSKFGDSPILEVNNGETSEEIAIGSYTALAGKLTEEDIGKKVKIAYLGEVKGKTGRLYMNFDVWKKEIKK